MVEIPEIHQSRDIVCCLMELQNVRLFIHCYTRLCLVFWASLPHFVYPRSLEIFFE